MSENCIAHDYAWAASFDLLDGLRPLVREQDVRACFNTMYERVKAAIAAALIENERERQRLNPEAKP